MTYNSNFRTKLGSIYRSVIAMNCCSVCKVSEVNRKKQTVHQFTIEYVLCCMTVIHDNCGLVLDRFLFCGYMRRFSMKT